MVHPDLEPSLDTRVVPRRSPAAPAVSWRPSLALLSLALLLLPAGLLGSRGHAQPGPERPASVDALLPQADTGRLVGFVREGEAGPGIARTIVSLQGPEERSVVADEDGYFRFELLPVGLYTVRAEHLAYATVEVEVEVVGNNQTTRAEIRLLREAIALEPLTVTVEGARPTFGPLVQAYERVDRQRMLGLGRILTRDDLERRVAQRLTEILQPMAGVRVERDTLQNFQVRMTSRGQVGAEPCYASLFVDGIRVRLMGESIDEFVMVNEIEILEVYRGAAQIPAEYAVEGTQCGVIAVWTRRGG